MLSIDYIKQAFGSKHNVSLNVPNNKAGLQGKYGEAISFEHNQSGCAMIDEFWQCLRCFTIFPYLKVKGQDRLSYFSSNNFDVNGWTYRSNQQDKKMSRVLLECLEACETLQDYTLQAHNSGQYNPDGCTRALVGCIRNIGQLPRAYQDDPLTMTPAIFVAWLSERHKQESKGKPMQFTIDFRPLSCLIAGNGEGFQSCYGNSAFPYKEGGCYNNSPSAYAYSPHTAVLYSLADDGKSLTNRAWVYFSPNFDSVFFGRFYGDEMNQAVCDKAAELLGFSTITRMGSIGNISNIAHGNVYLSDHVTYGYGACSFDDRIELRTRCVCCGDRLSEDEGDCLCNGCANRTQHCPNCGRETDEILYDSNGDAGCEDCMRRCQDCGDWEFMPNMTDIGNSSTYTWICSSCIDNYIICNHCNDWTHADDVHYLQGMEMDVCSYCVDNHFTRCAKCDDWQYDQDMTQCFDCGDMFCPDCIGACDECGRNTCNECLSTCSDCGNAVCNNCIADDVCSCCVSNRETEAQEVA